MEEGSDTIVEMTFGWLWTSLKSTPVPIESWLYEVQARLASHNKVPWPLGLIVLVHKLAKTHHSQVFGYLQLEALINRVFADWSPSQAIVEW